MKQNKNKFFSFFLFVFIIFEITCLLVLVFFLYSPSENKIKYLKYPQKIEKSKLLSLKNKLNKKYEEQSNLLKEEEDKIRSINFKIASFKDNFFRKLDNIGIDKEKISLLLTCRDQILVEHLADKERIAASTEKLPFLMAAFQNIYENKLNLKQLVKVRDQDFEESGGYVTQNFSERKEYTLEEIIEAIIRYSDNTAFHSLEHLVSRPQVYGMSNPIEYPREYQRSNRITARIGLAILNNLANSLELTNLRERLKHAGFTFRLVEDFASLGKSGWYFDNLGLLALLGENNEIKLSLYLNYEDFSLMEEVVNFLAKESLEILKNELTQSEKL